MGYIRHHAIVVIIPIEDHVKEIHNKAKEIFRVTDDEGHELPQLCTVSNVLIAPCNGYFSFLIGPDGSKEGWDTSDEFDARRATFKAWLCDAKKRRVWSEWVEVTIPGDDPSPVVTDSHTQKAWFWFKD